MGRAQAVASVGDQQGYSFKGSSHSLENPILPLRQRNQYLTSQGRVQPRDRLLSGQKFRTTMEMKCLAGKHQKLLTKQALEQVTGLFTAGFSSWLHWRKQLGFLLLPVSLTVGSQTGATLGLWLKVINVYSCEWLKKTGTDINLKRLWPLLELYFILSR